MAGRARSRSRSRSRGGDAAAGGHEVIWYRYTTPQGHPYYHQPQTNQTIWEKPCGLNDRVHDPHLPLQMVSVAEEVWQRCCDTIGRQYYHNPRTMQTVWEIPVGPNVRVVDHPALMAQQMVVMQGMYGGMPVAMPASYSPAAPVVGLSSGAGGNVENFIAVNRLDASAAAKLRGLDPNVRQAVMDRGDLKDARNPNAVLMGRIRDAEREAGGRPNSLGPASAGSHPPGSVDAFIAENRIDASAGDKLRALPLDIQKSVMDRGNLTDARNPNAMLMGRIRDAQAGR